MELLITKAVESILLPPGSTLVLLLLGIVVRQRYYRTGQTFIYTGVALLLLLSIPLLADRLVRALETTPPLDTQQIETTTAQAIVLLGGGRYNDAPEYGSDTVSRHALERARYTAYLYHKTKLPILVSAGKVFDDEAISEAELLQQVLEGTFLTVVRWVEDESRTTFENAQFSQALLSKNGVQHVVLVTHALHMPRSVEAFERTGLSVTPAPMGFHTPSDRPWFLELLPAERALRDSTQALHELLGRTWYWLRYYAWAGEE